jgi:hypothetical protein
VTAFAVSSLVTTDCPFATGALFGGATSKYFEVLGMPLVKTVTSAGPNGKPLTGVEVKVVFDQPVAGFTGRIATWLLSRLNSWTMG